MCMNCNNTTRILCLLVVAFISVKATELVVVRDKALSNLVDIAQEIPSAKWNVVRYATADNFTGAPIYSASQCLAHKDAVEALKKVQADLQEQGLSIKVWDAYRPLRHQWDLWNYVVDVLNIDPNGYVADPRKGGKHTRGTAIDLTLVNNKTGEELEMPTPFDEFSERAWRNYQGGSDVSRTNRALLEAVMEKHGFKGLPTEWWHFDFNGWEKCPSLDVPLE